ncbi:MAG: hypothetical protein CMB55_07785 [Euryarchaeota archaeon]|nr:hypothetical protein [Euryarchaeota archaeon]|tara:strand:+ start:463 stop:681 length:219 start_codon:yes stop_codon:yes gene_type:complete
MAWYLTTGELYEGETHVLAGNTYSGKTRTSESRRLVEGPEPKRARSSNGRLKGDDPSTTDINEAYEKPKEEK